jgi:hypothetical protein
LEITRLYGPVQRCARRGSTVVRLDKICPVSKSVNSGAPSLRLFDNRSTISSDHPPFLAPVPSQETPGTPFPAPQLAAITELFRQPPDLAPQPLNLPTYFRIPSSLSLPMIRPTATSQQPQRYTIRLRLPPSSTPPRAGSTAMATPTPTPVAALPEPRQLAPSLPIHHNRDLALQKYLLLHEQHESLRQHLDGLRPPLNNSGSFSLTTNTSPTTSPTRTNSTSSFSSLISPTLQNPRFGSRSHRRTSFPPCGFSGLEPVLDETILAEMAADEAKLCDVNEGIKRTLTELLNCEAVRSDRAFRTWVQCRLMDTERELRSGRRRRSAPEP